MAMAAFFDLDNTLVRGSSLYHLACDLVRKKVIPRREVMRFARQEMSFIVRRAEPEGVSASAAARALALVAGRSEDSMLAVTSEFVRKKLPSILVPDVLDELRRFQVHGISTWLVTASPIELASAIAGELGMSGAIGTVSEVRDGHYNGNLVGAIAHGPGKVRLVIDQAAIHGFELDMSWAYSDSINDLPLLASVGMPVVVNPNTQLLNIAKKNGWGVMETARRGAPAKRIAGHDPRVRYPASA